MATLSVINSGEFENDANKPVDGATLIRPNFEQLVNESNAQDTRIAALEANAETDGSWSPVLRTSAGTGAVFNVALTGGTYVRVGQLCFFWGRVTTTATTGLPSGNVWISGLPFTAKSGFANDAAVDLNAPTGINLTTSAPYTLYGRVPGGQSYIEMYESDGNVTNNINKTYLGAAVTLTVSGCYRVA